MICRFAEDMFTSSCSRRSIAAHMCAALVKKQVVSLDDLVAQVCVLTPEVLVQVVCLRL